MPLPSNVGTGTVTGNFSTDIEDVDLTTWKVTLRPSQRQFSDVTATPASIAFLKEKYEANLDADGDLSLVVPAVWDDPDLNPTGVTYQVIYTFPGLQTSAFYIQVGEGDTINLPAVNPAQQANGTLIIEGIPAGGADGYILAKASATSYDTEWIPAPTGGGGGGGTWGSITGTLSAQTDLSTALNDKAPKASPALTGTPTVPTAAPGTNTTQAASTAFVTAAVAAGGGGVGSVAWGDVTDKPAFIGAGSTAAAARTVIGAGTSDLALGTTSTTAKAGDYAPTWSDVSGKPAVIAAGADQAAARTAIGAGTSNLAIGTTGSTAMAGNKTAADLGGLVSNPTGITGATAFANIVKISETDYAALPTKDPATLYVRIAG